MDFIKTPVKGMRDQLPGDVQLRQRVMGLIRDTYRRYGFTETRRESAPEGCDFYHRCPFATEQCRKRPDLTDVLPPESGAQKGREHFVRCWNPVL